MDFKAGEIFVNDDKGVTALQFIADLVVKHKVTPPEVTTWEFDEIIAGGQRDRYVMAQTFAPYMTLINDPGLSKTGGNWSAALVPGYTDKSQSQVGSTGISSQCRNMRGTPAGRSNLSAWHVAKSGSCVRWSAATRRRAARC